MEKNKTKQTFIVIRVIYVFLILGVCFFLAINKMKETEAENNKVSGYPQINSEQSFRGSMLEDFQIYNVINAPINGTPIEDFEGIAVENFGVDQSKLLYIRYTQQEYQSHTNNEGDKEYEWNIIGQNSESTKDFSVYNGLYNLGSFDLYTPINNLHSEKYYPSGKGNVLGNTRYIIEYITSDDTVSFIAKVGNNMCVVNPDNEIYNMYLNSELEGVINTVSSVNSFASVIVYIFIFLGGLIALILGLAIIKLIQDKITEAGQ